MRRRWDREEEDSSCSMTRSVLASPTVRTQKHWGQGDESRGFLKDHNRIIIISKILATHDVPDCILSILPVSTFNLHLITLKDESAEAQKSGVTCSRSHSGEVKPRIGLGSWVQSCEDFSQ